MEASMEVVEASMHIACRAVVVGHYTGFVPRAPRSRVFPKRTTQAEGSAKGYD